MSIIRFLGNSKVFIQFRAPV